MDKWKDIELEKMKVGGNRNAREFFDDQPDWNDRDPITQRYNSKAAALYRDKISTLAQGQSWDIKEAQKRIGKTSSSYGNNGNMNSLSQSKSNSSLSSGQNYNSNAGTGGYQNGGGYSDNSYQQFNTQEFKDQKEDFFSRRQAENATRPDHLPPSQGGKYSGFGYSREPPPKTQSQEIIDSTLSSLASGWSLLSAGATKFAGVAKEKAVTTVNLASAKIKEGSLLETVQGQVTEVASKVSDIGKRGWNNLAGSNISSPQGENPGFGYQDNSYQRSHSVTGNLGSGMGNQSGSGDNDWGWQDAQPQTQPQQQLGISSSKSYQNQFNLTNDDDWIGFEQSNNNSSSYQNSTVSSSYQSHTTAAARNLKLQNTTQKLSEGFEDLDVKNVRPKSNTSKTNATKSAEDDAWNLLLN